MIFATVVISDRDKGSKGWPWAKAKLKKKRRTKRGTKFIFELVGERY